MVTVKTSHKTMGRLEGYTSSMFLLCVLFIGTVTTRSGKKTGRLLKYVDERINKETNDLKEEFANLTAKMDVLQTVLEDNLNVTNDLAKKMDTIQSELKQLLQESVVQGRQIQDNKNVYLNVTKNWTKNMKSLKRDLKKSFEDSAEQSLQNITKEIVLLKETARNDLLNTTQGMKKLQQNFEENINVLKPLTKHSQETGKDVEKMLLMAMQSGKTYNSCLDLYNHGHLSSGIFVIMVNNGDKRKTLIPVYCDMKTDNGGWTVFQRRQDGSVDFSRDWSDYKHGFGKPDGELWLGNEYINFLTDDSETHELRIELEDHEGNRVHAKYSKFVVGPESTNYTLDVSGYTGSADDALDQLRRPNNDTVHNGMQFSTKDRDNDNNSFNNCAYKHGGGWWFNYCYASHLNGVYHNQSQCIKYGKCIVWSKWRIKGEETGYTHNMKFTEMKLR